MICFFATAAWAQFPQPHAGWKLVPGGENLVASSYWGAFYQWNYAADALLGPQDIAVAASNGVLNATGSGYLAGPSPLGPWLYTTGDFGIIGTIQTGPGVDGAISLTGSLPKGTMYWQGATAVYAGITATGDYFFDYMDGTSAGPVFYTTLKSGSGGAPAPGQVTVELLRQGGQFMVYFNGVLYGTFADPGLFTTSYAMPGFQTFSGHQAKITQFALEVPLSDSSAQLIQPVGAVPFTHSGDSVGSLTVVTGKTFSVAVNPEQLALGVNTSDSFTTNTPDRTLSPKIIGEFGGFAVTQMGYFLTEPMQGHFVFDEGDAMIATGKATGRSIVQCADLIDGSQIPYWVGQGNFNKAQLTQIMQAHIQTVMSHYKGQCESWSVVNEAFAFDGTLRKDTVWQQVIGPSYIDLAFQAARQADPDVKLYLKDYGAENNNAKAAGIYNLVASMKQRGIPIDGVAMQAHWIVGGTSDYVPNHDSMAANIAKLTELGLLVRFTELDVAITLPASDADVATQASYFSTTAQVCMESRNCPGITVNGADDALSSIPTIFPGMGAATMFDSSFQPKPAYANVMKALRAAPKAKSTITKVNTSWGGTDIAQNTLIEVKGINLVPGSTPPEGVIWSNAPEFASGQMPTNLNGVSVTVNGKPGFIYFYCSVVTSPVCTSDQIDVLTPLDDTTGPVQIVVATGATDSPAFTANLQAVAPTLLLFNALGPVLGMHADSSLAGGGNLYPGATTPAKPGEIVVIFGTGFGLPDHTLTNGSSNQTGGLPSAPNCTVGGSAASVVINLISPGLYQLNLTIPVDAQSGDNPISCAYNGVSTQAGAYITVQQ